MRKTGIFFGTNTGMTQEIAEQLAELLNIDKSDVHDVAGSAPTDVADYGALLLGTSTWGDGDLQENWEDFINGLSALDLTGKKVALFGCGDTSMSDTFCNGVGILYDRLKDSGAEFVGEFNTDGYEFDHSEAVKDGKSVGLLIDNVNHAEMTPERLDLWATIVKNAISD